MVFSISNEIIGVISYNNVKIFDNEINIKFDNEQI